MSSRRFWVLKERLFPPGASLQSSHDRIIERHPCRFLTPPRCSDDWDLWNAASAISNACALAIATACRLRSPMGR